MRKLVFYLALFICLSSVCVCVTINTPMGPVEGVTETTDKGNSFYLFDGIPYAKPPVGDLRFKPPQPMDPWEVFEAPESTVCIHIHGRYYYGSEDCLYVYVYAPVNGSVAEERMSVMVYFHAGAFSGGSGNRFFIGAPYYFIDKNVILVTVNYRLGPLGFLSTEDSDLPGNYGVKDTIMALKWVQQNIGAFGGDPDRVTIFGSSAGAAIVHYLMLSPMAKGLFHYAISQSGTSIATWTRNADSLQHAQWLANRLKCPTSPKEKLVECLKNTEALDMILAAELQPQEMATTDMYKFSPRVDVESSDPFLPRAPMDIMLSGEYNRVPYIIGYNRDEGMILYSKDFPEEMDSTLRFVMHENPQILCRILFRGDEVDMTEEQASELCVTVRNSYMTEEQSTDIYGQHYIDFIGDFQFKIPILKTASIMSSFHPVYLYSFDFVSEVLSHPYRISPETGLDLLYGFQVFLISK